jgi:hypothetical protein
MLHLVFESARLARALSVSHLAAAARLAPGLLCAGLGLAMLAPPGPLPVQDPPGLRCERQAYRGVEHCTLGATHILRIDPGNPDVRFEAVLPEGYDGDGAFGECRDVAVPANTTGPGCEVGGRYPRERIGRMVARHSGAVAGFNADFFRENSGAIGLLVKNGERIDGGIGDTDGNETRRCSLSISAGGEVRIGVVDRETLPDPTRPWAWHPDPQAFHTTVSGGPLLVREGEVVDLHAQCMREGTPRWYGCPTWRKACTPRGLRDAGKCASPFVPRARTAVGTTAQGLLLVVVAPERSGLTLYQLAGVLVELGSVEAMALDGGNSSQMWYRGRYAVAGGRAVASGVLVFSRR